MSFTKSLALATALALVGIGCSGATTDEGDATIAVNVRQDALAASSAGIIWLNLVGVTDPTFNRWFPATPDLNGTFTYRINALRTGNYNAFVYAWIDNAVDPTVPGAPPADWQTGGAAGPAAVPIVINRGNNPIATIWLQQVLPADTVNNVASTINSIVSSLFTVDSGVLGGVGAEPVSLAITASDADGDSIQYAWSQTFAPASAVQGTFAPAAAGVFPATAPLANNVAASFTYVAPTAYVGAVTLSFTITDGNAASPVTSVVAVPLNVGNFGRGNAIIPVAINGLPNIIAFSSTKGTLAPNGTDTAVITLDAFDDANNVLAAAFTLSGAGCGTISAPVSNQVGTDTVFQAVYTASAVAGPCLITASVSDGTPGTTPTVANLTLTQAAVAATYAPAFAFFSPDNLVPTVVTVDPLLGAPAVLFSVAAVEPFTGAALSTVVYSTTDAPTSLFPLPFDAALGTSDANYITDACLVAAPGTVFNFTVTATATNPANGAASSIIWPVTVNCL